MDKTVQKIYWQQVIKGVEENIAKAQTKQEKKHLQAFLEYYKKCAEDTK